MPKVFPDNVYSIHNSAETGYNESDTTFGSGGGGGMDNIESRLDRLENGMTKIETLLEANLEFLKDTNKEIKEQIKDSKNCADSQISQLSAEVNETKRHTQVMTMTAYGLILAAVFGIFGIWFTVWSSYNTVNQSLQELQQKVNIQTQNK